MRTSRRVQVQDTGSQAVHAQSICEHLEPGHGRSTRLVDGAMERQEHEGLTLQAVLYRAPLSQTLIIGAVSGTVIRPQASVHSRQRWTSSLAPRA